MKQELKPIISKLMEIQRRCESMGPGAPQFALFAQILPNLVQGLKTGKDPRGNPVDYKEVAAALFPLAEVFQGLGFRQQAGEIVNLIKSLHGLADGAAPPPTAPVSRPVTAPVSKPVAAPVEKPPRVAAAPAKPPKPAPAPVAVPSSRIKRRWFFRRYLWLYAAAGIYLTYQILRDNAGLPLLPRAAIAGPIGALAGAAFAWLHGLAMSRSKFSLAQRIAGWALYLFVCLPFLALCLGAAMVFVKSSPGTHPVPVKPAETKVVAPSPAKVEQLQKTDAPASRPPASNPPAPVTATTPTQPSPGSAPSPPSSADAPLRRTPEMDALRGLYEAGNLVRQRDYAAATQRIEAATTVLAKSPEVIDAARGLLLALRAEAESSVSLGDMTSAKRYLDDAERVATQYGFSSSEIVQRRQALFPAGAKIIQPRKIEDLRPSIGSRVILHMSNGESRQGRLHKIDGDDVVLEVVITIAGGSATRYQGFPFDEIQRVEIPAK